MGKFVLGFLVGAAVGAGVALLLAAREQSNNGLVASLQGGMQQVFDEAKREAARREEELWQDFYARVPQVKQPPQN